MILQKITCKEKEKIEYLRRSYGHDLAVHAFSSLYLWQEQLGLSLYMGESMFCVKSVWHGSNAWYFPCGEESEVRNFISALKKEKDFKMVCLRWKDVLWMQKNYPDEWNYIPDEMEDEYIYSVREHLELKGGAYANMRTQVHRVERDYKPETRMLDPLNEEDAVFIIRKWRRRKGQLPEGFLSDDQVNETLIRMRRELSGEGVIVYLGGSPVSVVAGVPLSKDTFDIIVAKSTENLQGVSYYAKREFMKKIQDRFQYINLEDDMGIPGLRRMKKAMCPVRKNRLWEAKVETE
ncbi:MAG: phosphatidylglycerol lysyltransferase domain-containing protein [Lachnospiraceae bacterium]|nr:phosphatidylglycerol lysyltransferase domain-containing protein [Lachnospiraceae bacterium]